MTRLVKSHSPPGKFNLALSTLNTEDSGQSRTQSMDLKGNTWFQYPTQTCFPRRMWTETLYAHKGTIHSQRHSRFLLSRIAHPTRPAGMTIEKVLFVLMNIPTGLPYCQITGYQIIEYKKVTPALTYIMGLFPPQPQLPFQLTTAPKPKNAHLPTYWPACPYLP